MKRQAAQHTKFLRLRARLELRAYEAMGLLESLWHLAARQCPRGDIGRLSDEDIALAIDWPTDRAGTLIATLVSTGWLDAHPEHRLVIHDWHDHCDEAVKKLICRKNWTFASAESVEPSPDGGGNRRPKSARVETSRDKSRNVFLGSDVVSAEANNPVPKGKAPTYAPVDDSRAMPIEPSPDGAGNRGPKSRHVETSRDISRNESPALALAIALKDSLPNGRESTCVDPPPSALTVVSPESDSPRLDVDAIVAGWNDLATHAALPTVRVPLSKARRTKVLARIRDHPDPDTWSDALGRIAQSPFLAGQNDRGWRASFDWFIQPDSIARVLEGKYDRPLHAVRGGKYR